ncbi:MAG TPA: beta-L-arabinofuranosidase domain-containing protein [Mycobacteriales bacterium]|nr:beta-L-arabinofuranosidase domain-containing protein [Mycobacteriales bacterium]
MNNPVSGPVGTGTALKPLGVDAVDVTGGVWGRWQRINREISLPMAAQRLEAAGNVHNLQLAAGRVTGEFRGPLFMDSDLYKTVEAYGWENARRHDPALRDFIRAIGDVAAAAQEDDGYLNSYVQVVTHSRYAALDHSHEMYCAGHLLQAAVAVARGEGDPVLQETARRFADHLVAEFLEGGNDGLDGHPEIETALVEFHRLTGEDSYLQLARKLIENRGRGLIGEGGVGNRYYQDHLPVREAGSVVGHSVRALYLEAGIVDLAVETADGELLAASIRRWEDMVATKTAITGGVGSRHAGEAFGDSFELPPDRSYNETCAAIASIQWSWRLLLATGEARHADLIERTFYNAFAASTSADGERYFYVNPLQRRADHFEGNDPGRRREWYDCACCPPNIMRLVSSFGHYVATATDSGLAVHQYVPGTIEHNGQSLRIETDYPWGGTIRVEITATTGAEWELRLRVPRWSENTRARVGDQEVPVGADGYLSLTRAWAAGDTVTLDLDLTPRVVLPYRRIDALRGCAAIERGPLVYCLEQVDQSVDIEQITIDPHTAIRALPKAHLPGVGESVVLEFAATAVDAPAPGGLPYSTTPGPARTTAVTATAIPYFQWDNRDGGPMRVWIPVTS